MIELSITNEVVQVDISNADSPVVSIANTPVEIEISNDTIVYDDKVIYTAGTVLGGHRAVVLNSSELAIYADNTTTAHKNKVIGITTGAALSGASATIQTFGEITNSGWSWTTGESIYLSTNGLLTQTVPTSGFVLILGFAISATKMFINIKQPIIL